MLKSARVAAVLASGLLAAGTSQAASISYYLDQSNVLADGTNWLQVTIADGAEGSVDFTVQILQPLKDLIANCDIGINEIRVQRRRRCGFSLPAWTCRSARRLRAAPGRDGRLRHLHRRRASPTPIPCFPTIPAVLDRRVDLDTI